MSRLGRRLASMAVAAGAVAAWSLLPAAATADAASTLGQVEHIVIVVNEGRTFDSVLGRYAGVDGVLPSEGRPSMRVDEPLLASDSVAAATAWAAGANSGFSTAQQAHGLNAEAPFRVARKDLVPATWELAGLGVVGQRAFADVLAGGAANRRALFGYPVPVVSPTLTEVPLAVPVGGSLIDSLDKAGVGWAVYTQGFDPDAGLPTGLALTRLTDLVPPLADPTIVSDQARLDHFSSLDAFHEAVESDKLPAVAWVIGTAGAGEVSAADDLAAEVNNALARSAAWPTTVIVDTWDAWGGFADHVPPPVVGGRQLGFRVPLVVAGPLVAAGTIDSTVRSHASIVRLVLDRYGLAPRDAAQTAAASLADLVTQDGSRPPVMLRDDVVRYLPGVAYRDRVLAVYVIGILAAIGIVVVAVIIDLRRRRRVPDPGEGSSS